MAIKANITVEQTTDFSAEIELLNQDDVALDLTSYQAWGQMKKNYSSSVAATFEVEIMEPRTLGLIRIKLSETETANLDAGRYLYDVVVWDGVGTFKRAVEGVCTVNAGITKRHIDLIDSGEIVPS